MKTAFADSVLMIRPACFQANRETEDSNRFQQDVTDDANLSQIARAEFEGAVRALTDAGVHVEVFDDTEEPQKPDAVFPNNWVSFHEDGAICLFPMQARNRRIERRIDILDSLSHERGYSVTRIEDWSATENEGRFLEGTGSLVLDRQHGIAYVCRSPRTDEALVREWCHSFGYEPMVFNGVDSGGTAIYHTNVMMCIGDRFAVACPDCIPDAMEREMFARRLQATGHHLIPISPKQMRQFAGNMLMLRSRGGEGILAMSTRAQQSLTDQQCNELKQFARIVSSPLNNIEDCAGGSMRCMIAELFLPHQ